MTTARFTPVSAVLARALVEFIDRRNVGKSIEIGGQIYTLDHISHNTSAFWKSRGLSVYFRTGRSVIRMSDHWSASTGFERSRKLNCGRIGGGRRWDAGANDFVYEDGKQWTIGAGAERFHCSKYAGRFPFEMLAGRCGLVTLNRTCDHWSA